MSALRLWNAAIAIVLLAVLPLRAANYTIDPTHSFVHAEIDHFGTSTIRCASARSTAASSSTPTRSAATWA